MQRKISQQKENDFLFSLFFVLRDSCREYGFFSCIPWISEQIKELDKSGGKEPRGG